MGQTGKSSALQAAPWRNPRRPESAEKTNRALQLAIDKHLNTFPITGKESFREASKALTDAAPAEQYQVRRCQSQKEFLLPAPGRSRLKISWSSRPVHGWSFDWKIQDRNPFAFNSLKSPAPPLADFVCCPVSFLSFLSFHQVKLK